MRTILAVLLAASTLPALAQSHYVKPHVRKDGTYVQGHYQTNPNGTKLDNWSTQGNYNPYTGQTGTVNPYAPPQPVYTPPAPVYQSQQRCGFTKSGQYVCS